MVLHGVDAMGEIERERDGRGEEEDEEYKEHDDGCGDGRLSETSQKVHGKRFQ